MIIETRWPKREGHGPRILGANHTQAGGAELGSGHQIGVSQFEPENDCSSQIHWRQNAPHADSFRQSPLKSWC